MRTLTHAQEQKRRRRESEQEKEANETLEDLKKGKVDIIIGKLVRNFC